MRKPLTLSIIIPAYNEENHLPACLDSIAKQTVKPDQVIVVDNNSTDKTCEIAKKYDFVTLVHEKTQGLIAARNKGMNMANGDLLARLDADVSLEPNWTKQAVGAFEDPTVMAVAGVAKAILFPPIYSTFWTKMYLLWIRMQFNIPILWGSNMVIRKNAWQKIFTELSLNDEEVHEDQDISVVMAKHKMPVLTDRQLVVVTDSTDKGYWPKYWEYLLRMINTKRIHKKRGDFDKANKMYAWWQRLIYLVFVFIPFKIIFITIMTINTPLIILRGGHGR